MIALTAPMVNKLNQLIANGGGGGGEGAPVDLTPVLSAVAAVSSKADALQLAVDAIEIPPGGEGAAVDLTPVLSAVAAVSSKADALQLAVDAIELAPGGEGAPVDLTPVLSAVAAISTKADALQVSVDAIEIPAGSGGSVIKSKQTLNISQYVAKESTESFPISPVNPAKTVINCISFASFIVSTLNLVLEADQLKIINTSTATNYTPVLKMELIEYV